MNETIVMEFLPSLVPLLAGYALARWAKFDGTTLAPLLKYVVLPITVFKLLLGHTTPHNVAMMAAVGVAMALTSFWAVRLLPRSVSVSLSPVVVRQSMVSFVLPFMLLSWHFSPAGMLAAVILFIAMAATLVLSERGQGGFAILLGCPWLYGALAALLFRMIEIDPVWLKRIANPFVDTTWVMLLVFFGAHLHPVAGFKDGSAWLGAILRLAIGLGIAGLAIWLLPIPRSLVNVVWLAGCAPAGTAALSFTGDAEPGRNPRNTLVISSVVSLIALVVWRVMTV